MKSARIAGIAIAGGLALAVPFLVSAQDAPGVDRERMQMRGEFHKAHARHGHQYGRGMQGERGMSGGAFLSALDLTDAQRDKVFAVMHANAPAMREQGKILRSTRGELSKLALSTDYDEAKVKALTDRSAQAMSTMAQLRARSMNEVFRVLTPEQQAKVVERRARWEQRGAGRGFGPGGEGRRGAPGMEGR
ncbi:MAG: periplasmic heavy metal sensor, partial [Burkholderiales bacterium]